VEQRVFIKHLVIDERNVDEVMARMPKS